MAKSLKLTDRLYINLDKLNMWVFEENDSGLQLDVETKTIKLVVNGSSEAKFLDYPNYISLSEFQRIKNEIFAYMG